MINLRLFCSILIFGLLAGCAVGPDFHLSAPPPVDTYSDVPLPPRTVSTQTHGGNSQYFIAGKDIPYQWWTLFRSQALDTLIKKGFAHNPQIEGAQAALRQAQENARAQLGALFPSVTAQGFAQRQQYSAAVLGEPGIPPILFNLFNTQVNVAYTLDAFGSTRRGLEALCALVDYQRYVLEATYLTLAGNIATTAITEASLRAQIQATRELIQLEQNLLRIVDQQFQLGAIARSDVLSQQSQLAQTKATLPPLEKMLMQTRHALAALVGEFPSEHLLPDIFIQELQLPSALPISVPSKLVRQRPDIRAAEALVHQASAQIGVATANLLPQFTLSGNYGWENTVLSSLYSPANVIWTLTAQALQPVFQGGTLLARRRAAIAAFDQVTAQYRQTVLQAFQNVADALRAIEIDAKTLQAEAENEATALALLKLVQDQYKLGATTYLSLLNAQHQYEQALIGRIQAQALRYTDTAALFQALGGGWWNEVSDEG